MQLKQFYNIPTKVSGRKSAITFGDPPDCWHKSTWPQAPFKSKQFSGVQVMVRAWAVWYDVCDI